MTQQETIARVCEIVSRVYHAIGDYREPSDCFCGESGVCLLNGDYRNSGRTIEYVALAVEDALRRDGYIKSDEDREDERSYGDPRGTFADCLNFGLGGLTLRDLFALAALSSLGERWRNYPHDAALDCYEIADEMLAARISGEP